MKAAFGKEILWALSLALQLVPATAPLITSLCTLAFLELDSLGLILVPTPNFSSIPQETEILENIGRCVWAGSKDTAIRQSVLHMQTKRAELQLPPSVAIQNVRVKKRKAKAP